MTDPRPVPNTETHVLVAWAELHAGPRAALRAPAEPERPAALQEAA